MKKSILFPFICSFVFLPSCSLLQEKKDPSPEFISGNTELFKMSVNDLEEALSDYGSMGAGTYKVRATLLTESLLEMREKSKPLTLEIINKNIEEAKKQYTHNKTCFSITLKAINQSKYAYFEEWKGKVFVEENNNNLEFPLEWNSEALLSKPQIEMSASFHGKTEHYLNRGIACTETAVPLTRGLSLKLLPSFIQWPFDGTLDLSWNFVDPKANSAKKVKESYRGW